VMVQDNGSAKNITVIKITTEYFSTKRGIHAKKNLTFLKRKSSGQNILIEDANMGCVSDVFSRIIGLDKASDGVYSVVACNFSRDFELGIIDDWDYKLIPFTQ